MRGLLVRCARTLALALLCAAAGASLGLSVNALRPHGLPLVARLPYAQDCPEKLALVAAGPIAADHALRLSAQGAALLVDARPAADYARAHLPGARSMPLSVTEPVRPVDLAPLRDAPLVVVYCDSPADRIAALHADQLRQAGLAQVRVLTDGAAALRRRQLHQ